MRVLRGLVSCTSGFATFFCCTVGTVPIPWTVARVKDVGAGSRMPSTPSENPLEDVALPKDWDGMVSAEERESVSVSVRIS